MEKERSKWSLKRLKSMYFAMHCWKCKKFELPVEEYKQRCEENIQRIIDSLGIKEMKFEELNNIIKNSRFCKFERRNFNNNCPICKKIGISRKL